MTELTTYGWAFIFALFLTGFAVVGAIEWWENRR